jgi:hypothetical protein
MPVYACPSGPTIQTVSMKKNLELSDFILILWGLSQTFSDTSRKYNIFSLVFNFVKIWQCLTLCSSL